MRGWKQKKTKEKGMKKFLLVVLIVIAMVAAFFLGRVRTSQVKLEDGVYLVYKNRITPLHSEEATQAMTIAKVLGRNLRKATVLKLRPGYWQVKNGEEGSFYPVYRDGIQKGTFAYWVGIEDELGFTRSGRFFLNHEGDSSQPERDFAATQAATILSEKL